MGDMKLAAVVLVAAPVFGEDWPRFRGPNGSSVGSSSNLPVEFSAEKNLAWRAPVPFSKSSPIVVGGRVFLTAVEGNKLVTLALDANTGRTLWRRDIDRPRAQAIYRLNDPASPTPAASREEIFVFFPDLGLVSYTLDGEERWRHPLGPFRNFYGQAASPLVEGGSVVLNCDQQSGSYLLAVDSNTGRQRWKTERPGIAFGWATPIIYAPAKGAKQVIVFSSNRVESFSLATGERRWWLPVASDGSMGSPVIAGDILFIHANGHDQPMFPPWEKFAAAYDKDKDGRVSRAEFQAFEGFAEHFGWVDDNGDGFVDAKEWAAVYSFGSGDNGLMAIALGADGQLPSAAIRWRLKRNLPYIAAPVLYLDVLTMVRTGGVVTSVNPATGEIVKQGRAGEALGEYFAQPVAADGKLFLASEPGKIAVLKAAGEWEVLAVNDLKEEIYATPAVAGGSIIVRTREALYCFRRAYLIAADVKPGGRCYCHYLQKFAPRHAHHANVRNRAPVARVPGKTLFSKPATFCSPAIAGRSDTRQRGRFDRA